MKRRSLVTSNSGVAAVEMAFALPIMIMMIWIIIQLGLVFRATSGMQHALGEGARAATIWPEPPASAIKLAVEQAVYGAGPGEFEVPDPIPGTNCACLDVTVRYTQNVNLLLLPGPTITIERSKRVWTAGT